MKKGNLNPFAGSSASQIAGTSKNQVDDKDSNSWIPTSRSRAARYLLSESSSDEGSSMMEPVMANGKVGNEFDEHEDGEFSEDSDEEEFNDGYDEELMGDEADRQKMSLMTERDRELVIYERSERREKLKARFEIEKKLRQSKKLQSNGYDEVKSRSLSRKQKMEGKHDSKLAAMDELVARREDRRLKAEEREKRMKLDDDASKWLLVKKEIDGPKLVVNQVYSSSDSEESENDWGDEVVRIPRASQADDVESVFESRVPVEPQRQSSIKYVSNAKELSRIQMTRAICAKWVHMPFFDELIVGCFVRVVIEEHKSGSLYRICEVVKVTEGSSYDLEGTRTTKMVLIKYSYQHNKDYPLSAFSNTAFTDEEFERWKLSMKTSKSEIPTLEFINKKREEIRRANNYVLKDEDIDHILAVKKKLNVGRRNYALEKSILLKERSAALHRGDEQRVRELDYEIRALDETPREQDRTNSLAKIAVINQRNRKKNREIMEAAILESQEHKEEEGKKTEDPFIRRNTKPSRPSMRKEKEDHHVADEIKVIVDDTEMRSLEESQLDMDETTVVEENTSTADHDIDEPLPKGWIAINNDGQRFHTPLDHSFPARNMTFFDKGHMEEMFGLHDFEVTGLDESSNVDAADNYIPAMNFLPQSAFAPDPLAAMFSPFGIVVPMEIRPKKRITLEEYKRRRGLQ